MKRTVISGVVAAACWVAPAFCQTGSAQTEPAKEKTAPLYQVTVSERSVDAVNYQYRSGPTKIDFRGTVLLSHGKGEATVQSQRGSTEIDAKFENLVPPTQFGREYLSYVLWAISPEGAPHNLGEIVPDGSNHAHLRVSTDLQVFGLIVTAEPYSAVRQPSDVVVLENQIRPDTLGRAQPIRAKYELMPRGQYTYQVPEGSAAAAPAPRVSMDRYEAILEVYQAQNAIAIARAAHAEQYAPEAFNKAEQAFAEAQQLQSSKAASSVIVEHAREAAEAAEDARTIAERRDQEGRVTQARTEAQQALRAKAQAEAAAVQARAEADAARADLEAERAARQQAEAAAARQQEEQVQAERSETAPVAAPAPVPPNRQADQTTLRVQLLGRLNGVLPTTDTPRGLVVTLGDGSFAGSVLRAQTSEILARLAPLLAAQLGLRIHVEGYTDSRETQELSARRAAAVSEALVAAGLSARAVSSEGLGDSRRLQSNDTEAGRFENRRVEIVVTGEPIGSLPYWDRPYSIAPEK
jgi:flagellar motor protein MotB